MTYILEQSMSSVFSLVGVNNSVTVQVPDLDVSISRSSAEQRLVDVHGDALDGVVVSLTGVHIIIVYEDKF